MSLCLTLIFVMALGSGMVEERERGTTLCSLRSEAENTLQTKSKTVTKTLSLGRHWLFVILVLQPLYKGEAIMSQNPTILGLDFFYCKRLQKGYYFVTHLSPILHLTTLQWGKWRFSNVTNWVSFPIFRSLYLPRNL